MGDFPAAVQKIEITGNENNKQNNAMSSSFIRNIRKFGFSTIVASDWSRARRHRGASLDQSKSTGIDNAFLGYSLLC